MDAMTEFVAGSMRETVPEFAFATHRLVPSEAMPYGIAPTVMVATI